MLVLCHPMVQRTTIVVWYWKTMWRRKKRARDEDWRSEQDICVEKQFAEKGFKGEDLKEKEFIREKLVFG
jgi:hypothetical protein